MKNLTKALGIAGILVFNGCEENEKPKLNFTGKVIEVKKHNDDAGNETHQYVLANCYDTFSFDMFGTIKKYEEYKNYKNCVNLKRGRNANCWIGKEEAYVGDTIRVSYDGTLSELSFNGEHSFFGLNYDFIETK